MIIEGAALFALWLAAKNKGIDPTSTDFFTMFDPLFQKYGGWYLSNLPVPGWKILKAIAMNEAGIGVAAGGIEKSVLEGLRNPANIEGSKSYDGKSWGLMQVTLTTGRDYDSAITAEKLNDPEYSVRIASQYLAWVTLRFKTSDPRFLEWVVKSYNQGVGNTQKEIAGKTAGYAGEYWSRFQRNFAKL